MALFASRPAPAHPGDPLATHPNGMAPRMARLDALRRRPSELSIGERE